MLNTEPLQAIERAMSGLAIATTRLTPLNRNTLFESVTEFCWWVVSADEALGDAIGAKRYMGARNDDVDGRVVQGLRHVRHALGHSQLIATATEGGLTAPFAVPIAIQPITVRWRPANEVTTKKGNDQSQPAYARAIAGREVDQTLVEARRWLGRAQAWAHTGILPSS